MLIDDWVATITDKHQRARLIELRQRYEFLGKNLFNEFEPTRRAPSKHVRDFLYRLDSWLLQFENEDDRYAAFSSIEYLFFAGPEEFYELYRSAYESVARFVMQEANIDPFQPGESLKTELESVWFCPATDSLKINSFLHTVGLKGHEHRPDWFSLKKFADQDKLERYIQEEEIRYLVLLEDFSGSGKQLSKVARFAAETLSIPILLVPLIICAPGLQRVQKECAKRSHLQVRPIAVVPKDCLVGELQVAGEPATFVPLRSAMERHYNALQRRINGGPYGFNKVGSLVVTSGNCPNNTPPIYHQTNVDHVALFPRLARPWRPS